MSQISERIAQYRKMAQDDPENELGHFRLGQLLMEAGQLEEAARSFRRTLVLSPEFSKVYRLLGSCLIQLGRRDEAVQVLRQGFEVADERGDTIPKEEIVQLLGQLGEPAPESRRTGGAEMGGFRCQRPGCLARGHARQLPKPPMNDELGRRIYESVCADCWNDWLRNYSVKVINERRLDLSREEDVAQYDRDMKAFLGLE
jgi:Fe-S cluster biosynthesis and repair protein YggX